MALLAGGGSAQLRRDPGTAGAVDGQQAFGSALAGAKLATALPFAAKFQAADGQAQLAQQAASITGNLAATESGADTLSAEGVVKVAGSLVATETGSDTFAATGSAASGTVTGNLIAVESGADTLAAAGSVFVTGSLSVSETGADTLAATGVVLVSGALTAIETGDDTLIAAGAVRVAGALSATESDPDTFSAEGVVRVAGSLAATESGADTFAATGTVSTPIFGTLAATESGADSFAASGEVTYGAPPSAIWAYTLSNGLSAGETLVQLHAMLRELHQLHGLEMGSPLTVSTTQRAVAAIVQGIEEVAGTVTVTRH